jgi:hypothetical protein
MEIHEFVSKVNGLFKNCKFAKIVELQEAFNATAIKNLSDLKNVSMQLHQAITNFKEEELKKMEALEGRIPFLKRCLDLEGVPYSDFCQSITAEQQKSIGKTAEEGELDHKIEILMGASFPSGQTQFLQSSATRPENKQGFNCLKNFGSGSIEAKKYMDQKTRVNARFDYITQLNMILEKERQSFTQQLLYMGRVTFKSVNLFLPI